MRKVSAILFMLSLTGCAYDVAPVAVAEYNVVTSYSGTLKGKYLLYVEAAELKRTIKPSDFNCSAHNYPIDVTSSFSGSVRKTLQNMVDEIEVVDSYVNRDGLKARGARGIIVARGEDIDARMRVVPGFWTAGTESEVAITASITVDGLRGRLLGTTVEGDGNATSDAGVACSGGAASIQEAAGKAMKEAVRRLAEALGNSERVRNGG